MAKITIQIRIDPSLLDWVDEKGKKEDRSRSWLINDCVRRIQEIENSNGQLPSEAN